MNYNEIISEARGERRIGMTLWPMDYVNNPTAWSPELYQWIEEQRLMHTFIEQLAYTGKFELITRFPQKIAKLWEMFEHLVQATPKQRAKALALAINERGR